jgi:Domain of unknown function (DUF4192)
MDDPDHRTPDRRPEPLAVRIADPGEVAASLPALLGFHPRESVVLVGLTGERGRVGLTVRGDLPPERDEAATAAVLTRSVRSARPSGVLLAVVSEAPDVPEEGGAGPGRGGGSSGLPHRGMVHQVVRALARDGVPVCEALLVRAGRWWSYDCPRPCCAPDAGTALPSGVTELEVASVATGMVVERDRTDLARRIARPDGVARNAMAAACAQVAVACSARVLEAGFEVVAAESWSAITEAVVRCRPGVPGPALTDGEVARIVWGLRDIDVRDRALELAMGADAPAAEGLWAECTRRAPIPLDAAPATLLAVSAWLRGDGAMANVALTRALAGEPTYALAGLLAQALAGCVAPAELRALIGATLGRPGARRPG